MTVYLTTVTGRKQVAEDTVEVSFKRPEDFSFKAGQYIQVCVPELLYPDAKGGSRVFSISSSPLDKNKISIVFRDTGSGFKRTLVELPADTRVKIEGPHGFLTLPENPLLPLVFVAGGIGVAPYLSMIRFAAASSYGFPMMLLYANHNKERAAYLNELQRLASQSKCFSLRSKFGRIDDQFILHNVKDVRQCTWYLAGPPAMVDYTRNLLSLLGADNGQVHYEEFTGY